MSALIAAVGFVSGFLGIIQFGLDNFQPSEGEGSVIKVAVALDTAGLTNAGGDLPDVPLFNQGGEFLGISADPGKVEDGSVGTIKVSTNGQQATYALFSANDDAICIAYVTITWPDEQKYAWQGDWGFHCQQNWYFSNIIIPGSGQPALCMWIDGNGDFKQTGFQVHFPEFAPDPSGNIPNTKEYYCGGNPAFKVYTEPDPRSISYYVPQPPPGVVLSRSIQTAVSPPILAPRKPRDPCRRRGGSGIKKKATGRCGLNSPPARNGTARPPPLFRPGNRHAGHLIVDNSTEHATRTLCSSATSWGPDYANIADGLYCRMSDKSMFPICGATAVDSCFDLDTKTLIIGGKAARNETYTRVTKWGTGA